LANFNIPAYIKRLKLLREILSKGGSQTEFAKSIGVSFARWSNYERGYPVPREVAFILEDVYGVSVEWLWFGKTGNMPADLLAKIEAAEISARRLGAAERALKRAQEKVKEASASRKGGQSTGRRG
jgi:transcriptional regulator with XRE-family HTH domain